MTWRRTWASLALTPAVALGLLSGGSTAALAATNIETGPIPTIAAGSSGQISGQTYNTTTTAKTSTLNITWQAPANSVFSNNQIAWNTTTGGAAFPANPAFSGTGCVLSNANKTLTCTGRSFTVPAASNGVSGYAQLLANITVDAAAPGSTEYRGSLSWTSDNGEISSAAAGAGGMTPGFTTAATLGKTPGTYTYYNFDNAPAEGLSDVEFGINVTSDPGKSAKVFWSNQFQFSDGKNGYTGMQANGAGNARTFLFSVWDATEAKAGAAGSWCQDFGGEGVGKSCRMHVEWVQGHNYKFNLAHEGDRWFGVTVQDTTTGTSFKLGSIRAGSGYVKSTRMVSWTEYFEWNSSKATCLDQPYSRAEIALPRANAGAVSAGVLKTAFSPMCPAELSSVETTPTSTIQTNAIGSSTRGPIIGLNGRVLDGGLGTNNTPLTTKANNANNNENQNWVLAKDGTIRLGSATGLCLDAGGTTDGAKALAHTCHAGATQQWRSTNGTLVNPGSGKCLDVSAATNEALLYVCHGGANQQWITPKAG